MAAASGAAERGHNRAMPDADREPDPRGRALRRFRDPAYRARATDLAEVRANIDRLDEAIVALLAERATWVKDATRFKRDDRQVAAPARQDAVFERARALAARLDPGFTGFDDVVDATFRAMVTAFVARQAKYFDETDALEDDAPASPSRSPDDRSPPR